MESIHIFIHSGIVYWILIICHSTKCFSLKVEQADLVSALRKLIPENMETLNVSERDIENERYFENTPFWRGKAVEYGFPTFPCLSVFIKSYLLECGKSFLAPFSVFKLKKKKKSKIIIRKIKMWWNKETSNAKKKISDLFF